MIKDNFKEIENLMFELLDNVDYYLKQIKTGEMENNYLEFEFRKGQINYENICRRLKGLNEINIENPITDCLTLKDFKEHILEILTKILGDNYYQKIKQIPMVLEQKPMLMDGSLEVKNKNGKMVKTLKINNELYPLTVAVTNHEVLHLFIEELIEAGKNVIKNVHYNELPSILIEYITIRELERLYPGNRILEQHLMHRFNHDVAIQTNESVFLLPFKDQDDDYSKKRYREIKEFTDHNKYGYIISNIYALRLIETYDNDEEKIKYFYKELLSANKNIIQLLKEFNLSLNSKDTINPYIKKLEFFEQKTR